VPPGLETLSAEAPEQILVINSLVLAFEQQLGNATADGSLV
jgi:hypothetical protein